MKSKGIRFAMSLLVLTLGGLAISSHAQQSKVKFKFKDVIVPGAVSTDAYGINNKNVIVGDYIDSSGQQFGMYVKGRTLYKPSCPGYKDTALYAVNSSGTAVADCDNGGGRGGVRGDGPQSPCDPIQQPWCVMLYDNQVFIPIPDPPCGECPIIARGLNDEEIIVGQWQNRDGVTLGFSFDLRNNVFTSLDMAGGGWPVPWSINNAGLITVEATDSAGLMHSYLYDGTSYTNIDVPGAQQSFVHGINNNGDIVYTVEVAGGKSHGDPNGTSYGVLYHARQFYWFNQPDGRRTLAYGLNDEVRTKTGVKLKIVGDYSLPGSTQNQAFVATVTIK